MELKQDVDTNIESVEISETPTPYECRFGNVDQILQLMQEKNCHLMGKIEDFYKTSPHQNEVDIVDVEAVIGKEEHVNSILGVVIEDESGQELLRCIFKPFDGENPNVKQQLSLNNNFPFYAHEKAAFEVSRHFGLNLIPPTVIREINGQIGALQLFIDHDKYKPGDQIKGIRPAGITGRDLEKIAVLDWLLLNPDRRMSNMLINKEDQQDIIAIDHGICFNGLVYNHSESRGPNLMMTGATHKEGGHNIVEPKNNPLPPDIHKMLEFGCEREDKLQKALGSVDQITEEEISQLINRAKLMVRTGIHMSRYNKDLWRDQVTKEVSNIW